MTSTDSPPDTSHISSVPDPAQPSEWPFPWPAAEIAHYTAFRTATPPTIDGRLDEPVWLGGSPRSPRFRDLISGSATIHNTQAALLWDETHLYVGYWVEEPFVHATLTERDAEIYYDNDVELFIAGEDGYYELEVNAFGTIYETFFLWEEAYERKGYATMPDFGCNVAGCRPFNGVGFESHPRGPRLGFWGWDFAGLQVAVWIDGTLNDHHDRDRGWTVELALPWASMAALAHGDGRSLPPRPGDTWRMDFSRFNQYKEAPPSNDSSGWAWSPHGVWDSHVPELFPYIHFSDALVVF